MTKNDQNLLIIVLSCTSILLIGLAIWLWRYPHISAHDGQLLTRLNAHRAQLIDRLKLSIRQMNDGPDKSEVLLLIQELEQELSDGFR